VNFRDTMEDFNDVYPMICEEFKQGSTKEEAIQNICQARGLDLLPHPTICNWLKRIQTDDTSLEQEIGEFYYKLLCAVIGEYLKFNYAMFDCNNWDSYNEGMLSNRTLLVGYDDPISFAVFDTLNGESRRLQFENDQVAEFFGNAISMGNDRILIRGLTDRNVNRLYLLKVDSEAQTCAVIHSIENQEYYRIVLDSENEKKFVLLSGQFGDNLAFVRKGQVIDDQIHIEEHIIEFGTQLWNCKLAGNKFFAFLHDPREGNNELIWHFREYTFTGIYARTVKDWLVPSCPNFSQDHILSEYVWSKNKLYMLYSSQFMKPFTVIVFDSETRIWTRTKFIGIGIAISLKIDEDGVLIANINDGFVNYLKTIYRFPMRKPDKLKYIVWAKIRHEAMFFGRDVYGNPLTQLPYNSEFNPFFDY